MLKREWHGTQVRVGPDALRVVSEDGTGQLAWRPELGLTLDDRPFTASREGIALAEAINGLIQSYERWIEAREGREERLKRGHWSAADRRQVNALAETRRLNRLLTGGGGSKGRRRERAAGPVSSQPGMPPGWLPGSPVRPMTLPPATCWRSSSQPPRRS